MKRQLRLRFILFSMLTLFVLQGLIVLFSAGRTYFKLVRKADELIETVYAAYPEEPSVDARYFVARFSEAGEKHLDLTHIASVKRGTARRLLRTVLDGKKDAGFCGTLRYRIFREGNTVTLVFLSRSMSLEALKNSVLSMVLFSSVGLLVLFAALIALSFRVTRPIVLGEQRQKRFITAASHELGMPLTVISADTDILLNDAPENEWLLDIRKQVAGMTELTRNLTTLAKIDESGAAVNKIVFPISDAAEDTAASFRSVAESSGKSLRTEIQPGLSFTGDENHICRLCAILLDNAFRHSDEKSPVLFRLEKIHGGVSITTENDASALRREQLPHLFDRFYRAPDSGSVPGHGLGLAIAQSVVKAHGGRITASLVGEKTIRITVVLKE